MKPFLLKLDQDVYTAWASAAKKTGLTLSEWIRRAGNAQLNGKVNEASDGQPLRESSSVRLAEQRTRAPERIAEPAREPSGFSAVELETARRTTHKPGCECMQCLQTERFVKTLPQFTEPAKKAKR